jgi:myo-inositol-1(or 4)-monophosphatase
VAAGALIVEEARGTCSDRRGAPLRFNNAHPQVDGMVAAGRRLHPLLMRALGRADDRPLDPAG